MTKNKQFDPTEYLDSPEVIAEYLYEACETADREFIALAIRTAERALIALAAAPGV